MTTILIILLDLYTNKCTELHLTPLTSGKQVIFPSLCKVLRRNMKASLLLPLFLQGVLLFGALGVQVRMPKTIHGLKGSCLVIPCSFKFTLNPPKNPRVVWYQLVYTGYPLVYHPSKPNEVIKKFREKTDLYGNSSGDCSLLIRKLEQSHHGEKLYTGINSNKCHKVTSTILVDTRPQLPSISISGGEKMGDKITVTCSASHTCPYSKPNITLNGIEGSDRTNEECSEDGQCRNTLTRTGVVKTEKTTFECSVTHHGGINTSAAKDKSALCVHQKITIEPAMAAVRQRITQNFTCTVHHSCQKENPTITWNYENMQVSEGKKTLSGVDRVAYSTITFLGAKEDHGKKLICSAKLSGGNITAFVVFHDPSNMTVILTPLLVVIFACILVGVIIWKKRHRPKNESAAYENNPFSQPHMPLPKSDPKLQSRKNEADLYVNLEDLYENI
ncbi:sialoadhesin-like [Danio aesculapii]|uniref:sialoadhesin-like n=1 Tax=Danio aesculapii TaxID=1142201 RepID=UPI0024C036D7|nr:sialoadhesin-like [Danio aesculapii]